MIPETFDFRCIWDEETVKDTTWFNEDLDLNDLIDTNETFEGLDVERFHVVFRGVGTEGDVDSGNNIGQCTDGFELYFCLFR